MKHRNEIFRDIILFLIGVIATISCENKEYQFSHGNIFGTITDATTGLPIENCNISVSNSEGNIEDKQTTDSKGTYKTKDLSSGYYTVSIEKEDYYTGGSKTIQVKSGETTKCDLALSRLPAKITTDTEEVDFGQDESLTSLSFKIVNRFLDDLSWVAEYDCEWISSISPANGSLSHGKTETIIVKIDRSKLSEDENKTNVTVKSLNGQGGINILIIAIGEKRPISTMVSVTDVLLTEATLTGETSNSGSPTYYERGFVYGLNPITDITNLESTCSFVSYPINNDKSYQCKAIGLKPGRTYYARAYAKNTLGLCLSSNEIVFSTCTELTEIETLDPYTLYILNGRVTLLGNIKTNGSPVYSEKGFCINTSGEPTINDQRFVVNGTNIGEYEYTFTQFDDNTDYYYRAYAIQNGRVVYGNVVILTTKKTAPQLSTYSPTDFSDYGTVTLNGAILYLGTPPIIEKGFCYATHNNPTLNDKKITVPGIEVGTFSYPLWLENSGSTYYYRVYAKQGDDVYYGDVVALSKQNRIAQVKTLDKQNVSVDGAFVYGEVQDVGYPTISERGIVYGPKQAPTINDYKKTDYYRTTGEYEAFLITGLSGGAMCYYRAYVLQDGNPIYGTQKSFVAHEQPGLYTMPIYITEKYEEKHVTYYRTKLEALLLEEGYPGCDSYGFVYSSFDNPVVGDIGSITVFVKDTYIESNYKAFKHILEKLEPSKKYYVRAFGHMEDIYYYGQTESFITENGYTIPVF